MTISAWRKHLTRPSFTSVRSRRSIIIAIKIVHSVIFLTNSLAILHIFWVGIHDRPSRWTSIALAAALGESAIFVINRGRCPLTELVEDLGARSGRVSDLFLPRWFSDRIPWLCTPPLVIGLVGLVAGARRRHMAGTGVSFAAGGRPR